MVLWHLFNGSARILEEWDESKHPRSESGRFSESPAGRSDAPQVLSVIDVGIGPDEPVEIVVDGWVSWEGPKHEADDLVRAQWDEAPNLTGISIHRQGTGPRSAAIEPPPKPTHTPGGFAIPEHPKENEPGGKDWRDPPAELYHATLFGDEIAKTGFRPLDQLDPAHRVLGGSDIRSMSLTTRENAERYRAGVEVAMQAAQGRMPWDRSEAVAVAGRFGVSGEHAAGIWRDVNDKWLRGKGDDDRRWFDFLQAVSFAGRQFPLFVGSRWPDSIMTATKPPRIVKVALGGANQLTYNPSETEWKVNDPERLKVLALESWMVVNRIPRYVLEYKQPMLPGAEWDETKHPRGKGGLFTRKGTATVKQAEQPPEPPEAEAKPTEAPLAFHRSELPQVRADDKPEFYAELKAEGIDSVQRMVPVGSLKGIQVDLNQEKVDSMVKTIREKGTLGKSPLLASKDGYIVDGHHRWAAEKAVDPTREIAIVQVDLPIRELIARIEAYPRSFKVGVEEAVGADRGTWQERAQAAYKAEGVKCKAFKAWFGDWESDKANASKVVNAEGEPQETHSLPSTGSVVKDADGKPLVVYHGTAHGGFEEFDITKVDKGALYGPGFYFTEDKTVAESYEPVKGVGQPLEEPYRTNWVTKATAILNQLPEERKRGNDNFKSYHNAGESIRRVADGDGINHVAHAKSFISELAGADDVLPSQNRPETKAVYLNIRKPFEIGRQIGSAESHRLNMLAYDMAEEARRAGDDLKARYLTGMVGQFTGAYDYTTDTQYLSEVLRRAGYDGITHIGGDRMGGGHHHRVWIAFDANQIKSVDNIGTFDPKSPKLRECRVWWEVRNGIPSVVLEAWDEQDHPRGEGGKFASKGSSGVGAGERAKCATCGKDAGKAVSGNPEVYHARCAYFATADAREKTMQAQPERALPPGEQGLFGREDVQAFRARQQSSPEFKQWFGDSKVTTPDGKPLVVYKAMYPYDYSQQTEGGSGPLLGTISRPEEFPAFNHGEQGVKIAGFFGDQDTANRFATGAGNQQAVYPVYLSFQNPYVIDGTGKMAGDIQFGESGKPFRDAIRSGKYDSVIIRDTKDEGTVYVALKPEQVKSAVGNRGTFDPKSKRIDESDAWDESAHPRGQPGNAGQFASKGAGSTARAQDADAGTPRLRDRLMSEFRKRVADKTERPLTRDEGRGIQVAGRKSLATYREYQTLEVVDDLAKYLADSGKAATMGEALAKAGAIMSLPGKQMETEWREKVRDDIGDRIKGDDELAAAAKELAGGRAGDGKSSYHDATARVLDAFATFNPTEQDRQLRDEMQQAVAAVIPGAGKAPASEATPRQRLLQSVARAMYEGTQEHLKRAGIDGFTLYRGTDLTARVSTFQTLWQQGTDVAGGDISRVVDVVKIAQSPMSRWSTSYEQAHGDVWDKQRAAIAGVWVPREQIFSLPISGIGRAIFGEVWIAGDPKGPVRVAVTRDAVQNQGIPAATAQKFWKLAEPQVPGKRSAESAAPARRAVVFEDGDWDESKHPRGEAGRFAGKDGDAQAFRERQQTTPEFRAWFADSKVVDKFGKPRIVYHGTPVFANEPGKTPERLGDFTAFDLSAVTSFTGRQPRMGMDQVGHWFSTRADEHGAGLYAGGEGTVYPVYLSIRNPATMTFDGFLALGQKLAGWKERRTSGLPNPPGHWDATPLRNWLIDKGYDGIRFTGTVDDPKQEVWLALNSRQIKSATGNKGTFNPKSLRIDESEVSWTVANGIPRVLENWQEEEHPRGTGGRWVRKGEYVTGQGTVGSNVEPRIKGDPEDARVKLLGLLDSEILPQKKAKMEQTIGAEPDEDRRDHLRKMWGRSLDSLQKDREKLASGQSFADDRDLLWRMLNHSDKAEGIIARDEYVFVDDPVGRDPEGNWIRTGSHRTTTQAADAIQARGWDLSKFGTGGGAGVGEPVGVYLSLQGEEGDFAKEMKDRELHLGSELQVKISPDATFLDWSDNERRHADQREAAIRYIRKTYGDRVKDDEEVDIVRRNALKKAREIRPDLGDVADDYLRKSGNDQDNAKAAELTQMLRERGVDVVVWRDAFRGVRQAVVINPAAMQITGRRDVRERWVMQNRIARIVFEARTILRGEREDPEWEAYQAKRKEWEEAEHPRDSSGKFADKGTVTPTKVEGPPIPRKQQALSAALAPALNKISDPKQRDEVKSWTGATAFHRERVHQTLERYGIPKEEARTIEDAYQKAWNDYRQSIGVSPREPEIDDDTPEGSKRRWQEMDDRREAEQKREAAELRQWAEEHVENPPPPEQCSSKQWAAIQCVKGLRELAPDLAKLKKVDDLNTYWFEHGPHGDAPDKMTPQERSELFGKISKMENGRTIKALRKKYNAPWRSDRKTLPTAGDAYSFAAGIDKDLRGRLERGDFTVYDPENAKLQGMIDPVAEHEEIVKAAMEAGKRVSDDAAYEKQHRPWFQEKYRQQVINVEWKQLWKSQTTSDGQKVRAAELRQAVEHANPTIDKLVASGTAAYDEPVRQAQDRLMESKASHSTAIDKLEEIDTKVTQQEGATGTVLAADHPDVVERTRRFEVVIARAKTMRYHEQLLKESVQQRGARFLESLLPKKTSEVVVLPGQHLDETGRANVIKASEWLSRIVADFGSGPISVNTLPIDPNRKMKDRACAHGAESMEIRPNESVATIIHEFGHNLDHLRQTDGLSKTFAMQALLESGQEPQHMGRGYEPEEFGNDDKFWGNHKRYCGKFYSGDTSEVLSMGLQYLYQDPIGFAKGAPEHFRYTLAAIHGLLT